MCAALASSVGCENDSRAPAPDAGKLDAGSRDGGAGDASADAALIPIPDAGLSELGDFERDFCAPLAGYMCGEAEQCGCGAVVPSGVLDREACTVRWTQKCLSEWGVIAQAVQTGDAHVLKARADACMALIRERTPPCEHSRGIILFALCAPFITSDAAFNTPCAAVPWCAGGDGVCSNEGICEPRRKAGEDCASEVACETGLACLAGKCQALSGAGEGCDREEKCAPELRCVAGKCVAPLGLHSPCVDALECAPGLVCSGDANKECSEPSATGCSASDGCGYAAVCAQPRVCSPRLAKNAPCTSDRACAASLYCDSVTGTCLERPGLDAACGNGLNCAEGLGCDPSGAQDPKCLALPGAGQPCALGAAGPLLCAQGLGCTDGLCGALPGEGAACTSDNRCAEGLACDFTAKGSICVKPKALGEPCQNDQVCPEAAHCGPSGACEADQPDGTPCSAGNECSGFCGGDDSGGLSCRPAPNVGDACGFDEDCPDSLACLPAPNRSKCVAEVCRDL
jgi:hypothetical protein